jgi:hypothetical protein
MNHEINSHDWPLFCQRITELQTTTTVKLEFIGANGIKTEIVAGATLQELTFMATEGCSDIITLRLDSSREIVHEIVEPIQIQLHSEGTAGNFNQITIEAESGISILTIHPVIHSQILTGLRTR